VVHLRPRQWLDPDEELVPMGGATSESGGGRAPSLPGPTPPRGRPTATDENGHASTGLGEGARTVPIARAPAGETPSTTSAGGESWPAADFWGEDAESVHDALDTPVPAHPAGEAQRPSSSQRAPSRRRSVRAPAFAALAVAAAALIAAAVNGFGSAPAAPHSSASISSLSAHTSTPGDAAAAAAVATAARLRTTAAASQPRSHEREQPRSRSHSAASHAGTRRDARRSAPKTTPAAVRYDFAPAVANSAAPIAPRSVTPTPVTRASPQSRPGPTGTISLIGAGTSSSG